MGPWNTEQINQARSVPFLTLLEYIGAYYKVDREYEPLEPSRKSRRFHVTYQGRDFCFIFSGEKFVNELLPSGNPSRGGGGAIDFVRHLTGSSFVHAVKVCLDAIGVASA